uniref:Uncharacterized LOC103177565 n=2 Tax=Callorhinchus milii TaxID=7868 RepID=A0A4W3J5B0_CALMI
MQVSHIMKPSCVTFFIAPVLQFAAILLFAAFIKADNVTGSGSATWFFSHPEILYNETVAERISDELKNISSGGVATAFHRPVGNGSLFTEIKAFSNATDAAETTVKAGPTQSERPFIEQGFGKLKVQEGKSVILPCRYHNNVDEAYPGGLSVTWYREDITGRMPILTYNTSDSTIYSNRVFLSGDLSKGDASMTILNVTKSDHGRYFCTLLLPDGRDLSGDGAHLVVKQKAEIFGFKETVGMTVGIVAAAVGICLGILTVIVPHFREKMPCQMSNAPSGFLHNDQT